MDQESPREGRLDSDGHPVQRVTLPPLADLFSTTLHTSKLEMEFP
jgi:hypothetical protein